MSKPMTPKMIASMTTEQRQILYKNCMDRIDSEEAIRIVDMIVDSGLPFKKTKEISHGDPEMRAIEIIVNAKDNEAIMLDAAAKDMPPLSVLEPLIVEKLGEGYRGDNGGTIAAGYLIAKRLYALGYEKRPSKAMPAGSVAKTAATFRKKPGNR
ncbi:hypothetical protein [Mesorhizobium sp. STM 4661]|uniref:hypothetical protein n=1 Tax=Mesorhizobium sp. STM 4661 TaxID=1297570 RepID=UPI0002BF346D|nr:hypothetical protein [Mesorhizobium sp. STM 4661]CCV15611.1 conserved hypothetical protein [Mesorhizobium sp. STM 4661]